MTAEDWRTRFGAALAATRRARHLSQQELGQLLPSAARSEANVVQATVSSWESGTTIPTAEQIIALEEVLGVDLFAFLGRRAKDSKAKLPTAASIAADMARCPDLDEQMRPVALAMWLTICKQPD